MRKKPIPETFTRIEWETMTNAELSKKYKASVNTIKKWANKKNFPDKKTFSKSNKITIPETFTLEEWLNNKTSDLAIKYNTCLATIDVWKVEKKYPNKKENYIEVPETFTKNEYENMSIEELSKKYGVSESTVIDWIKRKSYDSKRRIPLEFTKELWMSNNYKTLCEIFKKSKSTIFNWAKRKNYKRDDVSKK